MVRLVGGSELGTDDGFNDRLGGTHVVGGNQAVRHADMGGNFVEFDFLHS
jgi:hypothetical protein